MRQVLPTVRALTAIAFLALPLLEVAEAQPPQGEFIVGPMFSLDGQRVVFSYATTIAAPWEVHSIRIDGTDERTLIAGSLFAGPVAFSPDGKRLVYRQTNRDARGMLPADRSTRMTRYMSSNADGTDARELFSVTGSQATFEGWAPQNAGVVLSARYGNGPLGGAESTFVVSIDGTQRRSLAASGRFLRDGRILSTNSGVTSSTITIADQDGKNARPITTEVRNQRQPVPSSDGKQIAFIGSSVPPVVPGSSGSHIYVVNIDGSGLQEVVADASQAYNYSFSPDGTKLLFEDTRDNNGDIYVTDLAARKTRRLTTDTGKDELPVWSPDGARVVFHSVRNGKWGIYLVNADGTGERRLR